MATGGCEKTSDEIFNFKCTPCAKKNRNREAVKYCVECQGYCCASCTDLHEDFPALEGHQLLDKSDFKTEGFASELPEIPTVRCKKHRVKIMDMYCGNHDVVGCTSCMAINHRTCNDVTLIQATINTVFQRADADKISRKLQENVKKLEKIIKARASLISELGQTKEETVKAIKKFRKDMEVFLDNLEKESLAEAEKEFAEKKNVLEQEKKEAEDELASMKHAEDDLQKLEANKAQQFVHLKTAEEKIKTAEDIIITLDTHQEVQMKFDENANIRDLFTRLKTLGSVDIGILQKPKTGVYSITGSRDLSIRLSSDNSTCHVFGSCLTVTGVLLLTDVNNRKLKRVDIGTMTVVDNCELTESPYFVCGTHKQEAAVTFYTKVIQFVSLGTKMAQTREMTLDHQCYGIAYKDDKLYVTDNAETLYIHNMAGALLKTVAQDSSRNWLFGNSQEVALSDNGDKMFIVDWRNKVIVLDSQGGYLSTLNVTELSNASGVCVDGRGNIFVCGYRSHNIVQIGQDGKKKGEVATSANGLSYPFSVCFNPKQQMLFVTQGINDTVKVFDLQ